MEIKKYQLENIRPAWESRPKREGEVIKVSINTILIKRRYNITLIFRFCQDLFIIEPSNKFSC